MADSDTEGEVNNLVGKAIESALAPIRVLTSRSAVKAFISTLLFLLTSTVLLTISTTAYLFFYYNYIPPINLQENIYLQYGLGRCPLAIASLEHTVLIAQQPYDIDIKLTMPRTPTNLAAGNFMVDLQLLGPHNPLAQAPDSLSSLFRNMSTATTSGFSILHHSRRPAMLTYTSPIPFLAQTLLYLPVHLLNFRDLDATSLRIPMFELLSFSRGTSNIPTHIRLEIQSDSSANTGSTPPVFNIPFLGSASSSSAPEGGYKPRALQVYSAKIDFCARFRGLRYAVYNYRVLSFVVFTASFYISALLSMGAVWGGFTFLSSGGKDGEGVVVKQENGDVAQPKGKADDNSKIKHEEGEENDTSGGLSLEHLSDTPATYPTSTREPALQYPGRPLTGPSAAEQERLRRGDVADDEDDDHARGDQDLMQRAWDRGREADSGIGTSMESENVATGGSGLSRRRSGRGSGGSRDRGR